jgi:CBS domain containing-hemolysin-like protein
MNGALLSNSMKKPIEFVVVFSMDLVAIFLIFKLAIFIRKCLPLVFHSVFPKALPLASLTHLWWIFAVWMFFFYYEGLYPSGK